MHTLLEHRHNCNYKKEVKKCHNYCILAQDYFDVYAYRQEVCFIYDTQLRWLFAAV